jgi:hypothetical protein
MLDTANRTPRTTCFRYEDYWFQNAELVAITRNMLARGTRNMAIATRINHRLRTIRAATRAWLKSNRNQKIIRANLGHTILFFDTVEEWRTLSNYEFALRLVCSQKLQNLNLEESKHWRRRAKIKWCTLGDENTKFFHTMATYRYRKSKIKVLCHDQEEFFDDSAKIAIATNFFTRLFREDRGWIPNIDLSRLYGQDRNYLLDLDAPFTWQEIEKAINNAPSGRSPGPDGFTNEFFRFYKAEMKDELLELFQSLYTKEIKLDGLNLASIALLPKKEDATQITEYRPISLQHSIPKLIAKVLANRLQPKMMQLVDEMQSGFIKNRSIVENFAAAIEMIQCSNKLRKPVIVLKLDFQKAFDSVHWEAILATLTARGFPQRWIWWVKHLLETSMAQILLNGQMGKKFKIEKGVRQGDPLSPYLYIIVADVLQQMIRKVYSEGILLHPIENGAPPAFASICG